MWNVNPQKISGTTRGCPGPSRSGPKTGLPERGVSELPAATGGMFQGIDQWVGELGFRDVCIIYIYIAILNTLLEALV